MLGHFQFCSLEIFDIQTPITLFFKAAFSWLEAVIQRRSIKNVFLKVSLNSQENTCSRVNSLIIKLQPSGLHKSFSLNFVQSLRTPFSQDTSGG